MQYRRTYNRIHSSMRTIVEQAFGLLKGRWRRLLYSTDVSLSLAIDLTMCAVLLHNFLLTRQDDTQIEPQQYIHDNPLGEEYDGEAMRGINIDDDTRTIRETVALDYHSQTR